MKPAELPLELDWDGGDPRGRHYVVDVFTVEVELPSQHALDGVAGPFVEPPGRRVRPEHTEGQPLRDRCANQCGGTAALAHYTWHGPGEPFPDASCIDIPASVVGTIGPLTYTVPATDTNGCTGDDTGTLTVAPGPSCVISPSDTTIAVGTTATLCGPDGIGLTYKWSTGETSRCIVVSKPGPYSLTVTQGQCVSSSCTANVHTFNCACALGYPDDSNPPRSEVLFNESEVLRERQEIEEDPHEEALELELFYQPKGFSPDEARTLAEKLQQEPKQFLRSLVHEELGLSEESFPNPLRSTLSAALSTAVGGFIPIIPFFFTVGMPAVVASFAISTLAHFAVGASKALVTTRSWWASGAEMTMIGILEAAITYGLGVAFASR